MNQLLSANAIVFTAKTNMTIADGILAKRTCIHYIWITLSTTDHIKALINYILNSPQKLIQIVVIEQNIWSWANLLLTNNVIFKTQWTLPNFSKVNEKLLRGNFCGTIKINKNFLTTQIILALIRTLLQTFICRRFIAPIRRMKIIMELFFYCL